MPTTYRPRHTAHGSAGAAFLVLAALMMLLSACDSLPPKTSSPSITLSACGASTPLATDTGAAPTALTSVYLGGIGSIGYPGEGGFVGFSGTLFQRLYALAPTTGATRWCDQFSAPYTYRCPPGAACAVPMVPVVGQPTLVDGVLYTCVRNLRSEVVALDAATGHPRWSRQTFCDVGETGDWSGSLPHAGNLIFAGQDALDMATGQTVWSTGLPVELQATDGTRVYGSYYSYQGGTKTTTTTLYTLDARTGALRWQVATPLALATIPTTQDGLLVVGEVGDLSDGAAFYGIDAATGAIRWRTPLAVINAADKGDGTPVFADGMVFTETPDGLVALDAATGVLRWRLPATQYVSPLVIGQTAYVGGMADLWAVDAATGRTKWAWNPHGNNWVGQPALADGILVCGVQGSGGLNASAVGLDPTLGTLRWQVSDGDQFAPPTVG